MVNNMQLKVTPDALRHAAGEVNNAINDMERALDDLEQIVIASSRYWEGEGHGSHMACYRRKSGVADIAIRRFRENVEDLKKIAGVYDQAEQDATEIASSLPDDVIV